MPMPRRIPFAILALMSIVVVSGPTMRAAEPSVGAMSGADRLFLSFAEEAAVPPSQWWEGQVRYTDASPFDALEARLQAAFQPIPNLEVGGRFGFGNSDGPGGAGGTGATDLDAWGKFIFGGVAQNTDFAVGGLVTVPTGDDTAGLGRDAFDFEAFGSLRHRSAQAIISASTGFRISGDGQIGGVSFSGKNSFFVAGGVLVPVSDPWSFVGELRMETETVEGGDPDFRALGGVNWRPFTRGILRGAVTLGLTDGAPDFQITAGYAYTF